MQNKFVKKLLKKNFRQLQKLKCKIIKIYYLNRNIIREESEMFEIYKNQMPRKKGFCEG